MSSPSVDMCMFRMRRISVRNGSIVILLIYVCMSFQTQFAFIADKHIIVAIKLFIITIIVHTEVIIENNLFLLSRENQRV